MSRTPCLSSFLGIGSMPHSGMPGPPTGPAFCSTSTWSARHLEIVAIDPFRHLVVVAEDQRRPGMLEETRLGG